MTPMVSIKTDHLLGEPFARRIILSSEAFRTLGQANIIIIALRASVEPASIEDQDLGRLEAGLTEILEVGTTYSVKAL